MAELKAQRKAAHQQANLGKKHPGAPPALIHNKIPPVPGNTKVIAAMAAQQEKIRKWREAAETMRGGTLATPDQALRAEMKYIFNFSRERMWTYKNMYSCMSILVKYIFVYEYVFLYISSVCR